MKTNFNKNILVCFSMLLLISLIPTGVYAKEKSNSFSSFFHDVYCGIFYKTDKSCKIKPRTIEESANNEVTYTSENDIVEVIAPV
jgi:hypothetical protein